ncbi:MAG: DUF3501 family protein [Bacteroidetes bacterium]|nr:DUF3501 family protein [Bacteroidota bacterium]
MKQIEFSELKNILEYEKIRNDFRKRIIQMKNSRRLKVGELVTLTFENRYTVTFQIEEMMRVERIVDDEKIKAEVETYNELIPRENELSATLFVEVDEQSKIRPVLDSLVGMNKDSVYMKIGGKIIPAVFEEGHATDDRISAVQYVRFKFGSDEMRAFADQSVPIYITIRHKNYNADAPVPDEMRHALYHDLTQGSSANVWD